MTSPSWLTVEYFQAILAKNLKNTSVKVLSIEFEPCGVTGGFLSTLLRVQVKYFMHSVEVCESFVVKLETTQGAVLEKVGKVGYDVQNKEMKFFEEVGPLMKKTLRKIGEHANFIPKVLKVDHENHVLIFEDLKSKNFDMVDCMNGLNENETKLALSKLAKFHAASLVINQKHSNLLGSFDIGMFSRKRNEFNFAFSSIFEIAAEEIATWEGFEHYGEKLQQLKGSFIENTTKCFDIQPGDFCVLNHGDIWTNNVMFKFDENGNAEDSILIDFQFCQWVSPALDLIHLLYTSLNDELFYQSRIDTFVQFYYYELRKILKKLEYDTESLPTLQQFQLEMTRKLFYGLAYTLTVYPIMTSGDPDNDFMAHHVEDERGTNFKRRMVKASKYQKIVRRFLPVFDQRGLLDMKF